MAGLTQGLAGLPSPPIKSLIIIDPAIRLPSPLRIAACGSLPLPLAIHHSHTPQLLLLRAGVKVPGEFHAGGWAWEPVLIPHLNQNEEKCYQIGRLSC